MVSTNFIAKTQGENRLSLAARFGLAARFSVAAFALLVLVLSGCGGSGGEKERERLRVFNWATHESVAHVSLGEELEQQVDIPYGLPTVYFDVPEVMLPIRVRLDDDVLPSIDTKLSIPAGKDLTYLLVSETSTTGERSVSGTLITDGNEEDPREGFFKIRVINAAISSEGIDVYITRPDSSLSSATPVAANVLFKAGSAFLEIDEGTYRIRLTRNNGTKAFFDSGAVTFSSLQIRTLMLLEDVEGGTPYQGVLLLDKN